MRRVLKKGRVVFMNRLEDAINMRRLQEVLGRKDEKKEISPLCWILAVCLIVAAVAAIAYAAYRYFTPDYLEDFEDDFEDDFDDDFFEDEEESDETEEEESKTETPEV